MPLGVDTPEDLERARALLLRPLTWRLRSRITDTHEQPKKIAFQGEPGANSDIACREAYPDHEPLPCPTFEDAFAALRRARPRSA